MNLDNLGIGVLVGALFVLIGVVGGGFRAKGLEIPKVPTSARFLAFIVGAIIIGFSLHGPPVINGKNGGQSNGSPKNGDRKQFKQELVVDIIKVKSNRRYVVKPSGLSRDAWPYIDRVEMGGYVFRDIPSNLRHATYIQTAMEDKHAIAKTFLSFRVNKPVTVYVGHDARYMKTPNWLGEFSPTGESLVISTNSHDATLRNNMILRLYKKNFSEGTVVLGGNFVAGEGNYAMYSVVIKER